MKKQLFISFILLSASLLSYGQYSQKSRPDSLIKIIPDGRHFFYSIDGKFQSPEDVRARLLSYPLSAIEYKSVKRNIGWSYAFMGAFVESSTLAGYEFYK